MATDKLNDIFERQRKFMIMLGNDLSISANEVDQRFINDLTLAAIKEMTEFLDEFPWKTWKKNQSLNVDKAKDELIDVLHFIFELAILLDMTPDELYSRYVKKNEINIERQNKGY